jgi:hypothetical protein
MLFGFPLELLDATCWGENPTTEETPALVFASFLWELIIFNKLSIQKYAQLHRFAW